jgi:hypothetical protein
MTVRCKFKCITASPKIEGDGATHSATFDPVYTGSDENKEFFRYTPGGHLRLDVVTQQHFEPGKEYYIDITPAE